MGRSQPSTVPAAKRVALTVCRREATAENGVVVERLWVEGISRPFLMRTYRREDFNSWIIQMENAATEAFDS